MSEHEISSLDRLWEAFNAHTQQDAERFREVTGEVNNIRVEMAKAAGRQQIVIPLLTTAATGALWILGRAAEWLISARVGH